MAYNNYHCNSNYHSIGYIPGMVIITGVLPFGHVTGHNCHSNRSYWSYHSQSWVKMRCRMTSKDHPNLRWTWGHWAEHLRSPTLKYRFWVDRKMWKRIIWLVVSTPLKNISQIGSSSQLIIGENKKCSKPPTSHGFPGKWMKMIYILGFSTWLFDTFWRFYRILL